MNHHHEILLHTPWHIELRAQTLVETALPDWKASEQSGSLALTSTAESDINHQPTNHRVAFRRVPTNFTLSEACCEHVPVLGLDFASFELLLNRIRRSACVVEKRSTFWSSSPGSCCTDHIQNHTNSDRWLLPSRLLHTVFEAPQPSVQGMPTVSHGTSFWSAQLW